MLRRLFSDKAIQGFLDRGSSFNPEFVAYTGAEQQQIREFVDQLYKELTDGKRPHQDGKPTLILATGVPGAGKTTYLKNMTATGANFVLVDNDDIREKLPFFQQTLKEKREAGATDREADRYAYEKHVRAVQYVSQTVLNRLLEEGYNIAHPTLPSRFGFRNRSLGMQKKEPNFIADALQLDHKTQLWIFEASDNTIKRSFDKRAKATGRYAKYDDLTPFDHEIGNAYEDLNSWPVEAKIFWRKSVNINAVEAVSFSRSGKCEVKDRVSAKKISSLRGLSFVDVQNRRFGEWSNRLGFKAAYAFDDENPLTLN